MTAPVTRGDMSVRDAAIDRIESQQDRMLERLDSHDASVADLVHAAVEEAVARLEASQLTTEERAWVRMAVIAAGKRARLVDALVEKGLLAAAGLLILGLGSILLDWLRAHGLKA